MKKRTGAKKKVEVAEKQFANLREKIAEQLTKMPTNQEKRKKKRKEVISGLFRSTDCVELSNFLFETDRKDEELTGLSEAAGVPDLFENIRKEMRELKTGYAKKHICYDMEMDAYTKIFTDAASRMKESGKEDLEIMMAILAEDMDDRRYP